MGSKPENITDMVPYRFEDASPEILEKLLDAVDFLPAMSVDAYMGWVLGEESYAQENIESSVDHSYQRYVEAMETGKGEGI